MALCCRKLFVETKKVDNILVLGPVDKNNTVGSTKKGSRFKRTLVPTQRRKGDNTERLCCPRKRPITRQDMHTSSPGAAIIDSGRKKEKLRVIDVDKYEDEISIVSNICDCTSNGLLSVLIMPILHPWVLTSRIVEYQTRGWSHIKW